LSRKGPSIAVVGSLHADIVVEVPRMPRPGETLIGTSGGLYSGGKGANQAVAAARLGADVRMYGKVGDDPFGRRLLRDVESGGVDISAVETEPGISTGLASVWVHDGENAIAIASGANARVDEPYIDRHLDRIAAADVVLTQFEIPLETIGYLLAALPAGGRIVILNPAPAREVSSLPLERIDILAPNEHELRAIGGCDDIEASARRLLAAGVEHVICTLGARGISWSSAAGGAVHIAAPRVNAVDSTAAGDAFCGALAWAICSRPLYAAIRIAVAAGALATTRRGAQPSLPTRAELLPFAVHAGLSDDLPNQDTDVEKP